MTRISGGQEKWDLGPQYWGRDVTDPQRFLYWGGGHQLVVLLGGGSGSFWKGTHLDETEHREYILRALFLAACILSVLPGRLWSEGFIIPCPLPPCSASPQPRNNSQWPWTVSPQDKENSSSANFLKDLVIATWKSTFEKVSRVWHIYEIPTIQKAEWSWILGHPSCVARPVSERDRQKERGGKAGRQFSIADLSSLF